MDLKKLEDSLTAINEMMATEVGQLINSDKLNELLILDYLVADRYPSPEEIKSFLAGDKTEASIKFKNVSAYLTEVYAKYASLNFN